MEYDIKMHLGQRNENFLNALDAADVGAMERIKSTILDIYKNTEDSTVVLSVKNWDKTKKDEIEKLRLKAVNILKSMPDVKTLEELFISVDKMRNEIINELNDIEKEYWEHVRNLFLKSVNNQQETYV